MSMISLVQSDKSGGSLQVSIIRWEGFVEKVGFVVKEWGSIGCWEWRWCERCIDKWMRKWIETRLASLTEWIWKLIPKTRRCISKWAICDFQWWSRKGDNRWGAGTARGLNRDQVAKIGMMMMMMTMMMMMIYGDRHGSTNVASKWHSSQIWWWFWNCQSVV